MSEAYKLLHGHNENELTLIPFKIKVGEYALNLALNVHKVEKVNELDQLTSLPENYQPFVGMYHYNAMAIPVIDLELVFQGFEFSESEQQNFEDSRLKEIDTGKRVLICHLQNYYFGILVDKTHKIESRPNEEILPMPQVLEAKQPHYFNGMLKNSNGIYTYMLDIEAILMANGVSFDEEDLSANTSNLDHLKGKRILVVEDSKLFQKKIKKMFEKYEFNCHFAENGQAGLEMIQENSYDLIFTDIEMPIMNGIEMIKEVKAKNLTHAPILFNSSISNINLIEEIESNELGEYLVKFDEKIILKKIQSVFK